MRRRNIAAIQAEQERLHRERRPAPLAPEPEVQQLLHRVAARDGRALVEQAVLADAEAHHGVVSANRVRDLLRPNGIWLSGLSPQLVSASYSTLQSSGLLRVIGEERISGQHTGNNSGKTVHLRVLTNRGFRVLRQARINGASTPWLNADKHAAMDVRAVEVDPHRAMPDDDSDDLLFDLNLPGGTK